jgi:hypothetical protein
LSNLSLKLETGGETVFSPLAKPTIDLPESDLKRDGWIEKFLNYRINRLGVITVEKGNGEPTLKQLDELKVALGKLETERDRVTEAIRKAAGKATSVEDIARVREPKMRVELAKGVSEALKDIGPLVTGFYDLEKEIKTALSSAEEMPATDCASQGDLQALLEKTMLARTRIRVDIPDGFSTDGPVWAEAIRDQLVPLTLEGTQRDDKLKQALGDKEALTKEGDKLKESLEKYQIRGMPRATTFFDGPRIGVAMSPEDMRKAQEATAAIAEKGRAILYNGGSYRELKKFMAASGITEEFWPPELVDSVQAWRKTQRALADERLDELAIKHAKGEWSIENLQTGWELVGNGFALDSAVKELGKKDDTPDGLLQQIKDHVGINQVIDNFFGEILNNGVSSLPGLYDFLKTPVEMVEMLGSEETGKFWKFLDKTTDELFTGLDLAVKGSSLAKDFGSDHVIAAVKHFLPGLSIAAAGVDLFNATKELGKSLKMVSTTKSEQKQGLALFLDGDVDEGMLGALQNELSQRKVNVGKDGVTVVTKGMALGGSIANTVGGHQGAAAQAGLAVVAGAITLGSKVIFSGIDWGKAKKAHKTLLQAQGGNMQAQIEIFENSGFYAKMYLAILCRDDQPLAKKFVIDRGIEEGDLDNVQGLKILREALLGSARQIDDMDVDIEKGFARFLTGKAGDAVSYVGDKLVELGQKLRSKIAPDYDPNWKYTSAVQSLDLAPATWKLVKAGAVEAGLIDTASGIGDALGKAAKPLEAADKLVQAQTLTEPDKATLLAGGEAVRELVGVMLSFSPEAWESSGSPRRVPHAGMIEALAAMRTLANTKEAEYWKQLVDKKLFDPKWAPAAPKAMDDGVWGTLWEEGRKLCCLPKEDGGVGAALATANKTGEEWTKLKGDPKAGGKEKRVLVLRYLDELDGVTEALEACLEIDEVNRSPGLITAIGQFMLVVNGKKREVDDYLAGKTSGPQPEVSWTTAPTPKFNGKTPFLAEWNTIWTQAGQDGFRDTKLGDAGLAAALKEFDGSVGTIAKAKVPSQDWLKAYSGLKSQTGAIQKAATEFVRLHRYSAEQLKEAAQSAATGAKDVLEALLEAQKTKLGTFAASSSTPHSKGWKETYQAAIDGNAVLKSGTARDSLLRALETQEKAAAEYDKETKANPAAPKKLRAAAMEYREAIEVTQGIIDMVKGLKGYGQQATMKDYLDTLRGDVDALLTPGLKADATGSSKAFDSYKPTNPKDLAFWRKNKDAAAAAGVVPDKATGITDAIKLFEKADAEWKKADKNNTNQQNAGGTSPQALKAKATALAERKTARDAQVQAFQRLVGLLETARAESENKEWVGYVDGLVEVLKPRLATL